MNDTKHGLAMPDTDEVAEPSLESNTSGKAGVKTSHHDSSPQPCPVCRQMASRFWLQAPDRFHGRHEMYRLVRCSKCLLVWLQNPPQPDRMGEHYTGEYDRLISAAGQNSPGRWRDRNAALAPFVQSGSLLDLGCSSGAFLSTLRGNEWKLFGIEMSAASASQARANSGAEVFVGDILEAKYPPESFDVITCFDVFEHLYEPRRVMARIANWLKPGGIFYVLVPNIDSVEARVFKTYWHGLELPRHLFHYSPTSLRILAESEGLSEVKLETRRNPAVGTSLRYVWDDVFRSVGIRRKSAAFLGEASLPWKVARKITRVTVLRALLAAASYAGQGESIHAIFRKRPAAK